MKKQLLDAAIKARSNSYSPYSNCKVGSALLMDDQRIFSGCNVENASYGATICAERSAVFSAIGQGFKNVKAILVVTDSLEPWPPCGMCRQVLSEFATAEVPVLLCNLDGVMREKTLGELCPHFFGPLHLS
ncbi:MAG: cytidine deaminase [Bdellovibrionales bacterium]|nr:cytidine deaminase [Bdellovibrionales bacterium]